MSSKHSRQSPTPSTPGSSHHASKLPKFLQKQANRDRSKSVTDPGVSGSPSGSSIASGSSISTSERGKSKFLSFKEREREKDKDLEIDELTTPNDEQPVIVEPINVPRPRTRSERPLSTASDTHPSVSLYASTSSTGSRIGDLPTRLSGWFSHTFSTSSTDLSLPALISQTQSMSTAGSSPKNKGSALLTAAKYGRGHLVGKAMRYILDSDATPDECPDPIWLLGVQHPGWEPPPIPNSLTSSTASAPPRSSSDRRRGSSPSLRSSTSSIQSPTESQSSLGVKHPSANWPPVFYADFTSRIWLTYRSHFTPIRDVRLCDLTNEQPVETFQPSSPPSKVWAWVGRGEKGWTSDSGWGCMLRTGQSLLANALLHLHLSRDWRKPPHPVATADFATYVQILTWFFDTPSPEAPFSVHRMALAGKDLGKDVGQWFGPSTAAGAIKTLASAFPDAALGVSVGVDGVVFQSDVYAASNSGTLPKRHVRNNWGDRAVLILVGIRLGLDGVNPIYYDSIKFLYTFPQSVGIAGGRPSSSYYFVGSQADSLFYLDPHHARPAIPLRPTPQPNEALEWDAGRESDREREHGDRRSRQIPSSYNDPSHSRIPASPSSSRTGSSTFSYHAPLSPSPLQKQYSSSSSHSHSSSSSSYPGAPSTSSSPPMKSSMSTSRTPRATRAASVSQPVSPDVSTEMDQSDVVFLSSGGESLDPLQQHYVTAYSDAELKTFHCDRVRKMPLSGLDPSMLLGFLCKDEADWVDFRRRVGELARDYRTIFSIQDEPPTWPSDSEMGLESISEPDDMDMDSEGEDEEGEEKFFDTRSATPSTSSASANHGNRGRSEEIDTEDDPVGPITPGPNSKFDLPNRPLAWADDKDAGDNDYVKEEGAFSDDIEDDWVDPISPPPSQPASLPRASSASPVPASDPGPSRSPPAFDPSPPIVATKSKRKKSKKGAETPVPVPIPMPAALPFPVSQRSPDELPPPDDRTRTNSIRKPQPQRMHTARARDGGRTQSGGVKGIVTDS
ncbi:Cysteine protease atg4 [Pleurotus ostreatus]|uniref:Autophagy-related protein 4 n=1 Tax=Pleurotus ostreatus TaxID=5322 RepID=A0A8H6ZM56_PLEOS|nr:Cysteine protease atg4 [Pleurotus ostreatus]KAF7419636.1 Cysteine protease atg4 [Pleurotus ostreatus]KAJ8689496.1 Cysteine protease atg4 [Pleurotus ostreatus]